MSKKKPLATVDFDFGVGQVIPATQESYHSGGFEGTVRKIEKEGLANFKKTLGSELDAQLTN